MLGRRVDVGRSEGRVLWIVGVRRELVVMVRRVIDDGDDRKERVMGRRSIEGVMD